MNRVPKELDAIMWTLAEEENPAAADEFLTRYPLYRQELMRRREMVAGLRTGRPRPALEARARPSFQHRQVRPLPPAPRQVAFVAFMVLAALAMASYTITSALTPRAPSLPPPAPIVRTETPQYPPEPLVTSPPSNDAKSPPSAPTTQQNADGMPPEKPKYLRPQSLAAKQAPLHSVIQMLAGQAAVSIVLAPGLPNPVVDVDYRDQNAIEILKDLGDRFHFTAFDQGDGSIVIYPAVDPNRASGEMPTTRIGG